MTYANFLKLPKEVLPISAKEIATLIIFIMMGGIYYLALKI
jgi:hypothetical protein